MPDFSRILWTPARAMFLTYLLAIAFGAAGLMLPGSTTGQPISLIDAVFTATSAVCVTGLVVFDTATFFTHQGQMIILGLIQLGGLGILTFTTWILMVSGRHLGVFERSTAISSYGSLHGVGLNQILLHVFVFTLIFEALGAGVLYLRLRDLYPLREAIYQSVFHSVSAFCNAGFSTIPNNLVRFVGDPLVNITICALIFFGGLGFVVLSDLWRRLILPGRRRLTLHSRVAISWSFWLIVAGMALILALEWSKSFAPLPWHAKLLAAFFQSVVPRTAGYNTVDIGALTAPTLFIIILLMIIGASPGSTGGGIKTTTTAILAALVRSQALGRNSVEIRERRIPPGDVARALAVFAMYAITLLIGILLVMIAQGRVADASGHRFFEHIVFECASALSTVGLSMNYTDDLTPLSRIFITGLMFCGRLGPIAVALTFIGEVHAANYEYPEEPVMTG